MAAAIALDSKALARMFRALGDETRVRVVALLSRGELCVCHIEEGLDLSQPNASRALGVLVHAGIVEKRREGTWMYFKLAEQADLDCRQQLERLVAGFGKREVLKADIARLLRTRGPGACKDP